MLINNSCTKFVGKNNTVWALLPLKKVQLGKDSHSKNRGGKKNKLTVRYLYHEKVQVGKDQEKAQSEKESHSKNQGGKKPN